MPPGPWLHWSGPLPDLSIKTHLPLRTTSGRVSEGPLACILPVMRKDQRETADTYCQLWLPLPLSGLMKQPGPKNYTVADQRSGQQPTDHSGPPCPLLITISPNAAWCVMYEKPERFFKRIIVKPEKSITDLYIKEFFILLILFCT